MKKRNKDEVAKARRKGRDGCRGRGISPEN